ncbi:hypothetical protein [Hydrogenophaga sp.]|uniref:hypothetical protein n=1 Tax=Hydrogenophaga sp. TaxID=1904254 RepID=UPI00271A8DD6|nr:hypothetical protein [Hydrogenophaga sp.]MDO8904178.1 hypothetical protein [Hydrogenophaga sp.]
MFNELHLVPAAARSMRHAALLMTLAVGVGLVACASPSATGSAPSSPAAPAAVPALAPLPTEPEISPVANLTSAEPAPVPTPAITGTQLFALGDLVSLMEHAERLRSFPPAELLSHIATMGDPGNNPVRQMQLALALSYTNQPPDTARALGLLQRVINHTAPESAALKPLARLLAAKLMNQRRLEDTVDRQAQQLRDSARRIEQLNERLEAMRAIERSLLPRPPAPGSNGSRPSPP